MFVILIEVMLQIYTCVKIYEIAHLKLCVVCCKSFIPQWNSFKLTLIYESISGVSILFRSSMSLFQSIPNCFDHCHFSYNMY